MSNTSNSMKVYFTKNSESTSQNHVIISLLEKKIMIEKLLMLIEVEVVAADEREIIRNVWMLHGRIRK